MRFFPFLGRGDEMGSPVAAYHFQRVVKADKPLLEKWLAVPDVARWFTDGEGFLNDIMEEIDDPRIRMHLVSVIEDPDDGPSSPFAYLHDYDVHGWNEPGEPPHPFSYLPPGSVGLDVFIGEPDLMGCGHGRAFLHQYCKAIFAKGTPAIGIDPHPENHAAIKAYQNVGFHGETVVDAPWGLARLMHQYRERFNA